MPYVGKNPTIGNFVKLDTITTSATATYNLLNGGVAYSPQSPNHCIVSLNGVIQSPTSAYTISGSTIVFDSALTSSDVIDFILVLGDVLNIGTPSDATVGFSKITSNLITGATAETSIAGGDSILIYDDSATALRKMTRTNFVAGIGGTNTPAFGASMGSSQSISNSTATKVNFDTEYFDTDSAYNTSDKRFTVPSGKDGKYLIIGKVRFGTDTDFEAIVTDIYKNGSLYSRGFARNFFYDTLEVVAVVDLVATDYIEIFATQESGGSVSISHGLGSGSQFFGFKLI